MTPTPKNQWNGDVDGRLQHDETQRQRKPGAMRFQPLPNDAAHVAHDVPPRFLEDS